MKAPSGFRRAVPADAEALLDLAQEFYREEGYPFDRTVARAAWDALLRDPGQGWAWVIRRREKPVGYLLVTFGYSLEYGGRTAFVDEIYLSPAHRGRGLGTKALALAERAAAEDGARAIHLEVERSNTKAHALYRRRGFTDRRRYLLTKRIEGPGTSETTRTGRGGRTSPSTSRGARGRRT
jgi:ribosomal protein S18 acetylase RimI-like enzyme